MSTGLLLILIVGAAACGWALLAVMGAERQRLRAENEAKRPKAPPPAAPAPPKPLTTRSAAPPRDALAARKPARGDQNAR